MTLADDAAIDSFIDSHHEWARAGRELTRKFTFTDFAEAMAFVNGVAGLAEEANHHPDIDIRWNRVTLTLSTHSEGGLTAKDLQLAKSIDQLL